MKTQPIGAAKAPRKESLLPVTGALLAALVVMLQVLPPAQAADPSAAPPAGTVAPVTLEKIPGTTVKRVTLSAKAAQRLGIELGKVTQESVTRRQMVSGLITAAVDQQPGNNKPGGGFGGFGPGGAAPAGAAAPTGKPSGMDKVSSLTTAALVTAPNGAAQLVAGQGKVIPAMAQVAQGTGALGAVAAAQTAPASATGAGDAWVLVNLSPGEWERLAKDKPARLLALGTREQSAAEIFAQPTGLPPIEDMKRTMLSVYYTVPGRDHGLAMHSRMRVELQLTGNESNLKVVPYSAVYYDGKGEPWVYVNTKPLTYERQRIAVERMVGNVAVLSDGPAVGTPIVTVGAAMLYGTEIFGK
ncbi:MAG: hypothetical protein WB821_05665 [Burkholderiaceae bacterium]